MQLRIFSGLLVGFFIGATSTGCPRSKEEASKTEKDASVLTPPPPITVREGQKDLVFSYRDESGFATAESVAAIPEQARGVVVVTDLTKTPAQRNSARYIYLVDLTKKRADDSFPVAVASRYGFEAQLSGTSTNSAAGDTTGKNEVVLYSAAWCGACKRAKQVLRSLGVPYVEKDIEASKSAQQELAAKAAAQGIRPSGVPVIDVGGVLLQGLDEPTLKAVLAQKGFIGR